MNRKIRKGWQPSLLHPSRGWWEGQLAGKDAIEKPGFEPKGIQYKNIVLDTEKTSIEESTFNDHGKS